TGLGRGLDALLPVDRPQVGYALLPVERIAPNPQQPRSHFDDSALAELAGSIAEVGVLQPIVVRPAGPEGGYVLVAGERRLRAAVLAGLDEIPAVIRAESGVDANLSEALIENLQRSDLGPLEEAAAFTQLLEDYGMTHEQVASRVGKSRSAVTNTVRLLQLPPAIQGMVERGELAAGHARALLAVDDEAYAVHIAQRAVAEGWSVRRIEEAVKARSVQPPRATAPTVRPAAVIELEKRLAERLQARVRIDYKGRGGRLVVRFGSIDELERIYRGFLG
ncbi:MAG: ParB/RepB/Spo0J family partition protein, partial [Actinobacteria bacterium]